MIHHDCNFMKYRSRCVVVLLFVRVALQDAGAGLPVCAAVHPDGWSGAGLRAAEPHLMAGEAGLQPVCGCQHHHLQRLLLHTGHLVRPPPPHAPASPQSHGVFV